MSDYKVMTSRNEQRAIPCAYYYVYSATSESEAIKSLYKGVERGQTPFGYLKSMAIPDYTCAVSID